MIDVTKKELKEIILQAMEVVYLKHQKADKPTTWSIRKGYDYARNLLNLQEETIKKFNEL